ncbi:baseplate J/gp47 family protein [Agathobaculum sp. NTUH-O15-33]|uniref:baseplate J/gp47 family protein n=1 Tax=Agathobaculum sp. NTUH-O15-33 TaxID=3079302 RepID=UPI002958D6A5|nr:baseplate J/gp47 family protein [Agathobaculum sp. NTUH-O15-33]WNX85796.1 baseplate J/gp47 family protein [Agathobaculum sp. NTUH-O15-33]
MSDSWRDTLQAQLDALKDRLLAQDFDSITPEGLLEDMTAFVADDLGLYAGEGGLVDIILRPGAYVHWEALQALRALVPVAFVDETSGPWIARAAAAYGITPKAGVRAAVKITFTGGAGAVVPAGTLCVTADGLAFETDAALTLGADGAGTVPATADEVGARYNVPAGTIVTTQEAVTGVTAVTNAAAAVGGTDPESDAALFARLDARRKTPATSGNEYHYKEWALEVNGIGAASVIRCWNGPGTVKVIVADMEMRPVADSLCNEVKAYIEGKRPVTAEVTVVTAAGVGIAVAATIIADGTVDVQTMQKAFTQLLGDYLGVLAFQPSAKVVYARVLSMLMGLPGVVDCSALTINGGTANVALDSAEVPILGTVTVGVASGA